MLGASCRQSSLFFLLALSPAGSSGSGGGRAGLFSDGPPQPRPSLMGRPHDVLGNATSTAPPSPKAPLSPPSSPPPSFPLLSPVLPPPPPLLSPLPPGDHNSPPPPPPPPRAPPLAPVSTAAIAVGASAAALALIGGAWGVSRLMRRPGGFGRIFGRRRARLGLLSDPLNSMGSLPPRSRLSLLSDPLNAMGSLPPVAPATPQVAECEEPATSEFEARGVATSRLVVLPSSS